MNVLVSGGNRGLGLEICRIILDNTPNAVVFLGCRDLDAGRVVAKTLSHNGGSAEAVQLDVSSSASVEAAATAIAAKVEHLDLLVNNAGVLYEEFAVDTAAETMQVNFEGVVRLTEACLPLLTKRQGAQILSTSSGMGARILGLMREEHRTAFTSSALTLPGLRQALGDVLDELTRDVNAPYHTTIPTVAYSLSKLGVNCYTQILAREHPTLRVNACSPGFTNTGMCANYTGSRQPKDVALGASVFAKVLFGELGAAKPTGLFFKESSKAGTPVAESTSAVDSWVQ